MAIATDTAAEAQQEAWAEAECGAIAELKAREERCGQALLGDGRPRDRHLFAIRRVADQARPVELEAQAAQVDRNAGENPRQRPTDDAELGCVRVDVDGEALGQRAEVEGAGPGGNDREELISYTA